MSRSSQLVALAFVLAAGAAPLAALEIPALTGRVVDLADLLPPDAEAGITETLVQLERDTGAQVAVLTIPSLEDEVLEDYSMRVLSDPEEGWHLGSARSDNGVLFLIVRDDRRLRIEVGYGLEGVLPDLAASRIIRNLVVPEFKAGDYPGGIEAGVGAIAGAIREEPGAVPDDPPGVAGPDLAGRGFMGLVFLIVVGTFSLTALGAKGCQGWVLYLFLLPFWFIFPTVILGPPLGFVPGFAWLVLFPILRLFIDHTPAGKRFRTRSPMMRSLGRMAASSGGFRGGGFSGGGGGFSGGGGSFGGGGASGSW